LEESDVVLRVRDLMTENLIFVSEDDSIVEAAKLMSEKNMSSIAVKHGTEFSGMITDQDILSRVVSKGLDPRIVTVGDVMSSPLVTISEEATIEEAAKKMRENKIRRLVVEKNHQKIGMIAESDIIRVYPELHYLIREQSRLQIRQTSSEPREVVLAGYCEECGNYSPQLRNINGRWLDEDCRTP
jgi:CBS domain-containing protein